jgi:flagellar basal-body rod protein FlgF
MDKGIFVAMTGASATLTAQASVAHNLANIDTVGFKAELAETTAHPIAGPGWQSRIDTVVERGRFDAATGPMIDTGEVLDVAMRPGYWLAVSDSRGREAYTRSGDMHLNSNGQLLTASGAPVLDQGGSPVAVPPHASISLADDGTLSIVPVGQGPETVANIARLKLVAVNGADLTRGVDGLMRANGDLPAATGVVLDSGMLEGSNVNPAQMMVEMIDLSRRFEMQIRMIRSVEENAQSSNSLLRMQ